WRFAEAARLVRGANGDRRRLEEARARLNEAAARRPAWGRVPLLQAQLAELEGNTDRAIDDYLRAVVELGEREPDAVRRLVQLLYSRRRYLEADQAIRKLQEQAPLGGNLTRLATEVALGSDQRDRALELAYQAVPPDAPDYRDHVWLGHVLW